MKSLRLLRGGHMKSLEYFWYTTTRIRGLSGLWPVCTVVSNVFVWVSKI